MIMVEVTKIWWDGERLMAEPIDSAIMYKDNEVAQPDSTCNKTLRAEGKGYPRTCRKCGKGPCIADRVQPEQEPSCKDCQTESPCRAKGQDLDVCSFYVPPPAAQQEPDAYGYAKRLAVAIWEQHYKAAAPQWKPFDDLMGILTQIDNMTAGLTTPTAAPVQEPVAWIEHEWSGSGLRHLHFERREQSVRDEVMNPIWTPLYTTPPAAQRQPLTEEQINTLRQQYGVTSDGRGIKEFTYVVDFARAIEAAHGITGEKT